jgi:hypothetical protein
MNIRIGAVAAIVLLGLAAIPAQAGRLGEYDPVTNCLQREVIAAHKLSEHLADGKFAQIKRSCQAEVGSTITP